ncbi:MAG: hypothetical protein V4736_10700, partial [Bdellovibrionota bacterium]
MQQIKGGNDKKISAHQEAAVGNLTLLQQEIVDARIRKFNDLNSKGNLPVQDLFLFIRRKFDKMPDNRQGFKFWLKPDRYLRETHLYLEIAKFESVIESLVASLLQLEIQADRLSETDSFALVHEQWNPGYPVESGFIATEDVRDQICLTDGVIGIDHFCLGSMFHKVISLKMLPEKTFSSMSQILRFLPFGSCLYFSIEVPDQQKEISSLQLQRRMAFASAVGKRGVSDIESQAKLRDLEGILGEMIQGAEQIFKVSLNIVLRSPDQNELDSQVAETLLCIREMNGAEGMLETVAAFDIFSQVALPHVGAKERTIKINTSVLADILPIYGDWKGHANPRVLLRNREGSLLPFDPFSPTLGNSNMILSGGSGAGKSYFANALISQMMKERPKVYILDVGASYKRVCDNLDGQYIELGIKSDISINPFDMTAEEKKDPEKVDQKIKFLVAVVELMTKEPSRIGIGRLERAEIEKQISLTLNAEFPTLSTLQQKLLDHPDKEVQRIGKILSLWCGDSPFGKFVDRPTTVEL